MAERVVEMPLENGGKVAIEVVDDPEAMIEPVGRVDQAVATTVRSLQEALADVSPAVDEVVTHFRDAVSRPDRIAVQFGIKITGEASAIITKATAEANFTVTAEWQRSTAP